MENTFDIKDCVCESATVYLDRAEVRRRVKVNVKQGDNEIKFTDLSNFIDEDSARVEGQGPATISEVSFQTRHLTPQEEEEVQSATKEIRNQINDLREKEKAVIAKMARFQKQRMVLNGFADSAMKPSATNVQDKEEKTLLNEEVIKGMREFFSLYEDKASSLDESIQDTEKETASLRQEIHALEKRINTTHNDMRHKKQRHLSVLLDAKEEAEVTLFVSYLVSNASWSPKYDIRVFSDEKKMKIVYHGVIRQGTGEDWGDVKISLSSAMPSVGGTVPRIGTQKVGFVHHIPPPMPMAAPMVKMARGWGGAPPPPPPPGAAAPEMAMMACAMPMVQATAVVHESISSAVYEIVRAATIPSDNTEHKVTVALIDLQPQFLYDCVPNKSTYAFLKAKVTNSSSYAMLAGPTNIFLDNNFIAKGSMRAVSPGEEFECSCGIDPAIKISYKPLEKHRANTGWMTKTKTTTFKQVIELRNTHQEAVHLRITEHLPLSTESQIKIHLQEPSLPKDKEQEGPVKLNKQHNLEWKIDLAAGVTKDLVVKYTIEQPANQDLEYSEDFPAEDDSSRSFSSL